MPTLTPHALSVSQAEVLCDMVENLVLEEDGGIRHLRHPYEPPTEQFSERLRHLAPDLRYRYWVLQCRSFLYGFYFLRPDWRAEPESQGDGSDEGEFAVAAQASEGAGMSSTVPLANNLYKGLDIGFYDELVASNCGEGYFDPGWQVMDCHGADHLSIQKHGLTLEVERDVHLSAEDRLAAVGDTVAVRLPAQRVEAERYIAMGNQGFPQDGRTRLQVFFNLQAYDAAVLMEQVTQKLNGLGLPFQLQVLSHPALYGQRCDGAVLEIERRDYGLLEDLLLPWAEALSLLPETLPMTQRLLPGLSVAERLNGSHASAGERWQQHPGFGLQRCEAIAQGLVTAQQQGLTEVADRHGCIAAALERWGVHPQLLYLNRGSEAIVP